MSIADMALSFSRKYNSGNMVQAIKRHLDRSETPQTPREIADALGISYNDVIGRLTMLAERGEVMVIQQGRGKRYASLTAEPRVA